MSSSPSSSSSSDAAAPFGHLADVRCPASVLLGTGLITIRQVLTLDRNSLLALTQSAGEDLQLVVNGVQVARGEVVVIEDSAALRVTEIAAAPVPKAVD